MPIGAAVTWDDVGLRSQYRPEPRGTYLVRRICCGKRKRQQVGSGDVRAENRIHGSDQQSCPPGASPAMITGHVPAVPVPPDRSAGRMAAAVPARADVENRRDLDPAPPAPRPAAAAAAPPEA